MEEIKMEREIDPLAIERSNNTDIEEQKPLSEEGNLLDLQVTGIKRENMDYSNDIKTEMTFDETPVSSSFLFVKTEVEEETCEFNKVEEEVKLEVTAEEDEVFTEGDSFHSSGLECRLPATILQRMSACRQARRHASGAREAKFAETIVCI
ncbi:uncharacterized protein [Periplaneta americana]|uniref:uncharacterized protein isoform X2 n=1 Tax=Periplaneta americana TaxID=6978 RepID=UPI0037E9521E